MQIPRSPCTGKVPAKLEAGTYDAEAADLLQEYMPSSDESADHRRRRQRIYYQCPKRAPAHSRLWAADAQMTAFLAAKVHRRSTTPVGSIPR